MILAINTSTPQFSVAVLQESGLLLAEQVIAGKSKNFRALMPALDALLEYSGVEFRHLSALATAVGPGSFTGLRVGLALAKGICHGLGIPAIGVSSLEAMASQWPDETFPICPIIESRKGEAFAAVFRKEGQDLVRMSPDKCLKFGDLRGMIEETTLFLGNDFDRQEGVIREVLGPKARIAPSHSWVLRASAVGLVGMRRIRDQGPGSLPDLTPSYLRPPDIRPNPFPPEKAPSSP
jgi:tRNA threonylcarbamoyladenosine biosynthesis protein TsaB